MTTADDPVHLAPNGDVRIKLGGARKELVLTRPGFVQMKAVIRLEARTQDDLLGLQVRLRARMNSISESLTGQSITEENLDDLTEIRAESRLLADEGQERISETLEQWWTELFTILAVSDPPEESTWPSVFLNPLLPAQLVNHWRFVPTGPG